MQEWEAKSYVDGRMDISQQLPKYNGTNRLKKVYIQFLVGTAFTS